MAFFFGDGFDLYATTPDAVGYWDTNPGGNSIWTIAVGRFSGSRGLTSIAGGQVLTKASGSNDAVHHISVAFISSGAISTASPGPYFTLYDGASAQCTITFDRTGSILLQSGAVGGATLATYASAWTQNVWYQYEFEVVINNTTGAFRVRRNGNTSNDFDSGATLNTRGGTANNYANKVIAGQGGAFLGQTIDDFLWRSDASSVPWVGDVRCYTRMPASDASAQFSKAPTVSPVTQASGGTTSFTNGTAVFTAFTASFDGSVGSAALSVATGLTANVKASIFAYVNSTQCGALLGSATTVVNPVIGNNTFTFSTPVPVTKGTQYYIAFDPDTTGGTYTRTAAIGGFTSSIAYGSFPAANSSGSASAAGLWTINITVGSNASLVNEAQQDGTTTYVYDSTVNDADLYNVTPISPPPVSVVALTTRGFAAKSDAGTRGAQVQLKSGGTTVGSTATALSTSFGWLWRTDTVDPATSAAWTPTAANAAQCGPKVTS